MLMIQVGIMFVVSPLAATGRLPPVLVEIFRIGLAAAAVVLLTRNRVASIAIIATFLVSLFLSVVMKAGMAALAIDLERLAATTAFDIAVAAAVANVAFGGGKVTIHRIMGAVILYLSIGLIFANAYRATALLLHPSFAGLTSNPGQGFSALLYFSLSTLTTTGFGDITPIHPFVRSLANLEAVIGQLFPATLLARLVTLHAAGDRKG
ncbi:potassium channel family protein [Caulobacter sp. S45]|uniref:potassium channel family protein n=1 Tax=Caulobacter sp. S45 TaxID=1641861 RepID=UPI0020B173B7|nr:potassium channel family protein [Caulobacter sp. S45]